MKNKIKNEEEILQERIKKIVEKNKKLEEENKNLKDELAEANNKVLEKDRQRQLELAKLFVESYKINKMLKHILIIFLIVVGIAFVLYGSYIYRHRSLFYHFDSSGEKFGCSTTFTKSSNEYILVPCKLKINNSNISYDDIKRVELKYDNQLIVWYDGYKSDLLSESIDSNEMFSDKKVRNIKKWQYEITYLNNGMLKKDTMSLETDNK